MDSEDDESDDEDSEDWEKEDSDVAYYESCASLLSSDRVLKSVQHALAEARSHGFNASDALFQPSTFYDRVKLANRLRHAQLFECSSNANATSVASLLSHTASEIDPTSLPESYLHPVLESDALLTALISDTGNNDDDEWTHLDAPVTAVSPASGCEDVLAAAQSAAQQRDENDRFELLRLNEESRSPKEASSQDEDSSYFDSYSQLDIHHTMLADIPRTDAYRRALEQNPSLIHNARVLDVGCGLGILSMFAARAGCHKAVGVDGSSSAAKLAHRAVIANGFEQSQSDTKGKVEVVSGRLEQLIESIQEGLPPHSFDVIVSEWMGYSLLAEGMLSTIVFARDHLLKPGGAVLPDRARLKIAACNEQLNGTSFWNDVFGFDFSCVAEEERDRCRGQSLVCDVPASSICSTEQTVLELDMMEAKAEDAESNCTFELHPLQKSGSIRTTVYAVVLWFDVDFSERFCRDEPALLSTSPSSPKTHWSQTLLRLSNPQVLGKHDSLNGRISFSRSGENNRCLAIAVESSVWRADNGAEDEASRQVKLYTV
jgi:protein arginine N-methyltransferase 3